MKKIELKPGDIFLSKNPMYIGMAINAVQSFWANDRKSIYSHAGWIIGRDGETFEALWTVKNGNIFKDYAGERVFIARHKDMTHERFITGYRKILKHKGQVYPAYRILLHIIPPLSRIIHFGRLVCSELLWKALRYCGLVKSGWYGQTPDSIHDYIKNHRDWEIVFEGNLED